VVDSGGLETEHPLGEAVAGLEVVRQRQQLVDPGPSVVKDEALAKDFPLRGSEEAVVPVLGHIDPDEEVIGRTSNIFF
jgi:hypothetical protein